MKILYIHGDDDFAALRYEDEIGQSLALEKIGDVYDKDVELAEGIYGRLIDVGEVSATFIQFLQDEMLDYDDLKHKNYYFI